MNTHRSLIISDFDGTIVDTHVYTIPKALSDFLSEPHGITLVLATSRSWDGVLPYRKALGLRAPQILENGSVIIDPVSESVLSIHPFEEELRNKVLGAAQACTVKADSCSGRITLIADRNGLNCVIPELKKIMGITFITDRQANSIDSYVIDITPEGVTKFDGVTRWLDMNGRDFDHVYFVGNAANDIPLFEEHDHPDMPPITKVAVEDGIPDLKEAADLIVPSATKNGFLHLLEIISGRR